jgi:type I restriction enzyme S subunit
VNWESHRFSDVAKLVSGNTPSKGNSEFWDGNIPWLSAKDLKTNRVRTSIDRLTEAGVASGAKMLPANSIFFVVRGMSLANEFRVSLSEVDCAFNQDLKGVRCNEGVDPEFLFYALFAKRDEIRQRAGEASHGTKKLPTEVIEALKIRKPDDIDDQRKVAAVASKYDDLIENNRRRIALLEEAARQLYKEWFVRFRFPGHEHVPIVDGVPEGWEIGAISDFYRTASGGTPSRKVPEFFDGDINWVKTQELVGGFIYHTDEQITQDAINKSSAKLFPKKTVLVAMYGATIGQTAILAEPSATNQACCALMPKDDRANYAHAYTFLNDAKPTIVGRGKGAAQNNISQEIIKGFPMVMPPDHLMEQFTDAVIPVFTQVEVLGLQTRNLVRARDLLLPKLMSGEIVV